MSAENPGYQEFKLDVDCELRFEIETKDQKATVEVSKLET